MTDRTHFKLLAALLFTSAWIANEHTFAVSPGDNREKGDAILKKMSQRLRSADALTFSTDESIERTRRNNDEKITSHIQRELAVRRPDRLWFKATGDRNMEGIYDGTNFTLISHKEKVFGKFPAAPTIDETADMISGRYDIPLPVADLLTKDPKNALTDTNTSGGWQRTETVNGIACDVLNYRHPEVEFSLWVPVSGDPLPQKLQVIHKSRRGQPRTEVTFKNWNLSPQLENQKFIAKVPTGYEGIPIIQRASAVIGKGKPDKADDAAGAEKPKE